MTVTTPKLSNIFAEFPLSWKHRRAAHHPPIFLWFITLLIVALALLPFGYLIVRASGAGYAKVWDILLRPRTLEIFLNSAGLALGP